MAEIQNHTKNPCKKRKQYQLLINLEEEEKRYLLVVDDHGPMGAEINQI